MTEPAQGSLAGLGILVTRPEAQARELIRALEARGARVLHLPALEIAPPADPRTARRRLEDWRRYDLAIFVSANAVRGALGLLGGGLPPGPELAAVGPATARTLAEAGAQAVQVPERADSEGLLALPRLRQVAGERILIVRGEGGREHLARELAARGARVAYAEVYRRRPAAVDPGPILARWRSGEISLVIATSAESLAALATVLGPAGRPLLQGTPLVVISDAMIQRARALGIRAALVRCPGAGSDTLTRCIENWYRAPDQAGNLTDDG